MSKMQLRNVLMLNIYNLMYLVGNLKLKVLLTQKYFPFILDADSFYKLFMLSSLLKVAEQSRDTLYQMKLPVKNIEGTSKVQ